MANTLAAPDVMRIAAAALLLAMSSVVLSLPQVQGPLGSPYVRLPGRRGLTAPAFEGRSMLRLRGGVPVSDEESTESSKVDEPAKEPPTAAGDEVAPAADLTGDGEPDVGDGVHNADERGEEDGQGEGGESEEGTAAVMERPKPTPEVVRQMNERMWEAAQEDEAHTGLNAHWMELNNYTALHLAAACGNAGIIDALLEAGADINVECLQRVHPFPTHQGSMLSFLTLAKPMIFKCTALRLARAANCGRCFYTSYQRSCEKLQAANAVDNDFHYPINTVVLLLIFGIYYLGSIDWPFAWYKEWPYNFDDFPDFHAYMYGSHHQ